jgi:glycosyltransferase involved in cell wall biosynthesis
MPLKNNIMRRVNLHIYPSPYKFETRINKEVNSIIDMDLADEIIIVGTWGYGLEEFEQQSDKIKIRRIKTVFDSYKKNFIVKILCTLLFNIQVFFEFKNHKLSHLNCHSLWVLPLSVFLKKITSAKLIYDAHELETERVGLRGLKQKMAKWLERSLIKYVDITIVVGDLIAEWYKKEYNLEKVYVIRNVPSSTTVETEKSNLLRQKFNIPSSDLIYIYQGVINKGRGVDIMIDTFSKVPKNNHLIVMGFGALENKIIKAAEKYENIHFMPAVKPEEIPLFTSGADIGLIIAENLGLSYYYGLPNKLFEYLYCGLPVVTSNFPEMGKIVNDYQCGWTIEPKMENLEALINEMSSQSIEGKKSKLKQLYQDINWEKEAQNFKLCFS